ncbi:MAG TPA: hypothetical protein DEB30_05160 [Candidatus Peribacter riflensis]|uniref:Uncharacterized protein n=1 Tax=Candidatus Peribacter riflensis TaxID=1735162 RepID=A0A0S1SJ76_9BACT|nr:MAG: hypothetical protein PeribacterA2_0976 [Candidatus Peribacter riflensis]OGJ78473.1 MAG: hypothetical protein A2398_02415 [Candidatus Peribacteria bacterium RIFOXYB1_FULL_57_12]OGJ80399.1 MAG: hypothetical protein A2412_00675 [Candidatus Peribacteria bacterium RIFOXYC1_FULL_58_8]ALM11438.1 MAG: hypothetical protein PeribacterB2_0978 [Candidatus Peribacter riflensis]ALM12540.1 MAG: hypothetical protein PeribacterC2_0977 [Candidatus Peribacter riflensis]
MVAFVPNEEFKHRERVEAMRTADTAESTSGSKTMGGREAVTRAMAATLLQINQLRAVPGIELHIVEQLRSEASALEQKSRATEADNALFVQAESIHRIGQRAMDLIAA